MKLIKKENVNGIINEYFDDIQSPISTHNDDGDKIYVRYTFSNPDHIKWYGGSIVWRYQHKGFNSYHKVLDNRIINFLEESYSNLRSN